MLMARCALVLAILLAGTTVSLTQDREHKAFGESLGVIGSGVRHKAAYSREIWIGVAGKSTKERDLLKALGTACNDTTSVAAVESSWEQEESEQYLTAQERAAIDSAMCRLSVLRALQELALWKWYDGPTPARKQVRVVLVGVLEDAITAIGVANHERSEIDSLLFVDPPVEDLPQVEEGARRLAVDVLLHSRSNAEFERDEATLRGRLGPWGKSARVMRGPDPFASLESRLKYAAHELRGYTIQSINEGTGSPVSTFATQFLAEARVIHVGELHGNPGAHRLQLEALRALIAQGQPLALSTEQFERDVQVKLDAYLKGEITEEQFLKDSRPWPNYADYRPLIELCKEKKIPVIAGNIPRRLASRVHKEGVEVIEKFTDEEKSWTARKLNATPGAYRDKFMKAMGAAEGHNAKLDSMYAAQCIKDDTMAESIAEWLKANPKGRVLHINGAFHSENGLGVPEKLKALMPEVKQAMLTCYEAGKETPKAVDNEWYVRVPASRP